MIGADRLVKLPDAIDFKTAAAMMLQGMTAQYLLRRTHRVQAGETIVVHAAAGGVGLIMCQWAAALGATKGRRVPFKINATARPTPAFNAMAMACN